MADALRLKVLRRSAGLTQARLGLRAGIHGARICLIERRRYTPTAAELARLGEILGADPASLLDVVGEGCDAVR